MKLSELVAAFIAQTWAAVVKLPTEESFEASGEVAWALRNLKEAAIRLEMQFPALKGMKEVSAVEAEVGKQFLSFLKTEGEAAIANAQNEGLVIPKAAHELAISTAAANAESTAKQKFEKTAADNAEAATHRATLITAGLPADAAAKIPTELLVGDNAEATKLKVTERLGKLTTLGLTAADNAEQLAMASDGLDAEGDTRFHFALSIAEKTAAAAKASAAKEKVSDHAESTGKPPGNPAEVPAAPAGKRKRFY